MRHVLGVEGVVHAAERQSRRWPVSPEYATQPTRSPWDRPFGGGGVLAHSCGRDSPQGLQL